LIVLSLIMDNLQQWRLENGLNVFFLPQPAATSVAIEFMVRAGSKNESGAEAGLAHFLEHMVFRGTKKWPRYQQLSRLIDGLGGISNAYTDKENTAFWLKLPPRHLAKGLEIMGQLMARPLFQANDIDQERGVIIEELRMYQDRPMDMVDDLFEEQIFGHNRLGRPIIGYEKTISGFAADNFQRFHRRWYRAGQASLAIVGALEKETVVRSWVKKYFMKILPGSRKSPQVRLRPGQAHFYWQEKDSQQTHLFLGFPTVKRNCQRKWAGKILATLLGGGFSSRLNREIRQKRGWAYYILAMQSEYQPGGYLAVKAGVRRDKINEALKIIEDQLLAVTGNLRRAEIDRAKNMLEGRVLIGMENPANLAALLNKGWLFEKKVIMPQTIVAAIQRIDKDMVREFAARYLRLEKMRGAIIGRQLQ